MAILIFQISTYFKIAFQYNGGGDDFILLNSTI